MSIDVWQALLPYQSGDLVRRLYRQRNQRSPNEDAVPEIRAHFVQGASYFQAAKGVADVVKPLILYYGCLALSRGTILFLSPGKREATLKQAHGLGVEHWTHILSPGDNRIVDLTLKLTNGTFRELLEATKNMNYLRSSPAFWQSYQGNLGAGRKISILEILSRIPRLKGVHEGTLCQPSNCLFADFQLPRSAAGEVTITIGPHNVARLLAPDRTLAQLCSLPGVSVIRHDEGQVQIRWSTHGEGDERSPVPIAKAPDSPGWADYQMVVLPFDDGSFFSQLLMCFLVAYFLGMLVRYHPSAWMGLLYGGTNDEALPLLRAAVDHVEQDFPKFVLNSLTERPNF